MPSPHRAKLLPLPSTQFAPPSLLYCQLAPAARPLTLTVPSLVMLSPKMPLSRARLRVGAAGGVRKAFLLPATLATPALARAMPRSETKRCSKPVRTCSGPGVIAATVLVSSRALPSCSVCVCVCVCAALGALSSSTGAAPSSTSADTNGLIAVSASAITSPSSSLQSRLSSGTSWSVKLTIRSGSLRKRRPASCSTICSPECSTRTMSEPTRRTLCTSKRLHPMLAIEGCSSACVTATPGA